MPAGVELPRVGAWAALVGYATDPATVGYQPCHVNFGLVPPLEDGKRRSKRDRYQAYADRALEALTPIWLLAPICLEATGHSL